MVFSNPVMIFFLKPLNASGLENIAGRSGRHHEGSLRTPPLPHRKRKGTSEKGEKLWTSSEVNIKILF